MFRLNEVHTTVKVLPLFIIHVESTPNLTMELTGVVHMESHIVAYSDIHVNHFPIST